MSPLARVAGHGLRPVDGGPLRVDDGASLVDACSHDHLEGFLVRAIEDDALELEPDVVESARTSHRKALAGCVALEGLMLRASSVLVQAGVGTRVLKGAALARLDYDVDLRTFGDIDLLIRHTDWDRAVQALEAAGYARMMPTVRRSFERRFAKGATFLDPHGFELDLHRTLATGRFGLRIDLEELFDAGEGFSVGGYPFVALDPPRRLVHAAVHAVLGGNKGLRAQRDVAQLAQRPDVLAATDLAERWGCGAVLAYAVVQGWRTFDLDPDHPLTRWAVAFQADPEDVAALHAFTDSESFRDQARTGVKALPRFTDRIAYLSALAFPSRASLQQRSLTPTRHLATALRKAAR